MPVVVAAAAGDDRDRRPQLAELAREAGIGGAVVGDLEDLDAAREEPGGDVRLGVGGQQRVDLPVGGEQRRSASRFGSSVGVPGRSGQSTRSRSRPEPEGVAGTRLGDRDAAVGRGGERRPLVRARDGETRVEDAIDARGGGSPSPRRRCGRAAGA